MLDLFLKCARPQTKLMLILALMALCLANFYAPPFKAIAESTDWPMWGYDLANHRYNPTETKITASTVNDLEPKWAFVFPDTMFVSSQPAVIDDTVYVGSGNGNLYALDVHTGAQKWAFFTGITGKIGVIRVGPVMGHDLVMFGDQLGRFYAVNKANGTLAWIQEHISSHPTAQITGSPVVYGDRVYVPMASHEEGTANDDTYPCCTFRGSLTALNISDGSIAWQFYTVEKPKPTGRTAQGVQLSGPSGAGIWSTPAIDANEGLIYLTTGNSYSQPVAPYSDAMIAVNLSDGSVRWAKQLLAGDWWNMGCDKKPAVNCDGKPGPDHDFGSAPILFSIGSRKVVGAEQKNGILHVLDAKTGEIVWEKAVGIPTSYPWGLAYDGQRLYVSDNSYDRSGSLYALDPASGNIIWHTDPFSCIPGIEQAAADCWSGSMAATVSTPGLVWLGAMDGQIRAFDSQTGQILWSYDTATQYILGVNGLKGHGGSIGPTNASIANSQVYVVSSYAQWNPRMLGGNVLFVLGLKPRIF